MPCILSHEAAWGGEGGRRLGRIRRTERVYTEVGSAPFPTRRRAGSAEGGQVATFGPLGTTGFFGCGCPFSGGVEGAAPCGESNSSTRKTQSQLSDRRKPPALRTY